MTEENSVIPIKEVAIKILINHIKINLFHNKVKTFKDLITVLNNHSHIMGIIKVRVKVKDKANSIHKGMA